MFLLLFVVDGRIPKDRVTDGVDQTDFLTGHQKQSNRESFVIYVEEAVQGVKWRDWKMLIRTRLGNGVPSIYNLLADPKERGNQGYGLNNYWVRFPAGQVLQDHLKSLKQYPAIPSGTPDPYVPGY